MHITYSRNMQAFKTIGLKARISENIKLASLGVFKAESTVYFPCRFAPVSTLATAEPTRCKPCRLARNTVSGR